MVWRPVQSRCTAASRARPDAASDRRAVIHRGARHACAVDVYTGRLLWQREFPEVGLFYESTDHHPGAGAIGGNYVCTADSVYLAWGRRCLRLDPATGATLAEFSLPPDESGAEPYWGYLGVLGDDLVAGSSPMLLLAPAPGEKIDAEDKEQLKREVPLFARFGEGSRRLVVLDRWSGQVHWSRDATVQFPSQRDRAGRRQAVLPRSHDGETAGPFPSPRHVPVADFQLYALELATGNVLWQSAECAFGTWLAYSEANGQLLQGGSKNNDRAADEVGAGLALAGRCDRQVALADRGRIRRAAVAVPRRKSSRKEPPTTWRPANARRGSIR